MAQQGDVKPTSSRNRKSNVKRSILKLTGKYVGKSEESPAVAGHKILLRHISDRGGPDLQLSDFLSAVGMNEEDLRLRYQVMADLKFVLEKEFPDVKLYPFGSVLTGLGDIDSDIDIYVDCGKGKTDVFSNVARILRRTRHERGVHFGHIVKIPFARIPIIKTVHSPTRISCDLSFENFLSVRNSRLINLYTKLDPRVRPLLCLIRYWGKFYDLTDSTKIKNYGLNLLVLVFLSRAGIIPSVYHLQNWNPKPPPCIIENWNAAFFENESVIVRHLKFMEETQNVPEVKLGGYFGKPWCKSILQLMLGFFQLFATFPASTHVVCSLTSQFIPRSHFQLGYEQELPKELDAYKEWCYTQSAKDRLSVSEERAFVIQDPFVLNFNVSAVTPSSILQRFQQACAGSLVYLEELLLLPPHEFSNRRILDYVFVPINFSPIKRKSSKDSKKIKNSEENGEGLTTEGSEKDVKQLKFVVRPSSHYFETFWHQFSNCGAPEDEIVFKGNALWLKLIKNFFQLFFDSCFLLGVEIKAEPIKSKCVLTPPQKKGVHDNSRLKINKKSAHVEKLPSTIFNDCPVGPCSINSANECDQSSTISAENGLPNGFDSEPAQNRVLEEEGTDESDSDESSLSFSTIDLISSIILRVSPRELYESIDTSDYKQQKLNITSNSCMQNLWDGRGEMASQLLAEIGRKELDSENPMETEAEISRRLLAKRENENAIPEQILFECQVSLRPSSFKRVQVEVHLRKGSGHNSMSFMKASKACILDTIHNYVQYRYGIWTKELKSSSPTPSSSSHSQHMSVKPETSIPVSQPEAFAPQDGKTAGKGKSRKKKKEKTSTRSRSAEASLPATNDK